MEIYSRDFFKIAQANLTYSVIDSPLGKAIQMPAVDAFIYSSVTGAGYLENPVYPFTPKGLLKIFYSALQYKFVTGIFDNNSLRNTPLLLEKARPYLFKGLKNILPIEFQDEITLGTKLNELYAGVPNPEDYIIQRIEAQKNGNGMEPFMEYMAAEYYKRQGFIVETQIPLAHSTGSPDFGGYKLAETIDYLSQELGLSRGFHLIELSLLPWLNKKSFLGAKKQARQIVVGEAKTSVTSMQVQISKYLKTGFFNYGIEISPILANPTADYLGLLTLDASSFKLRFVPPAIISRIDQPTQQNYIDWLINYFKFYLLANLDNDQFNYFYLSKTSNAIGTQEEIANFVSSTTIEDIVKTVKAAI
jgi:hypothetical protein